MGARKGLDTQSILNAAAELAEEQGLDNVSLMRVAQKLGVKSPSLYNHLSGLRELSAGISEIAASRLGRTVSAAAVGCSKGEALMASAKAYREFAKAHPELYKAILRFPDYTGNVLEQGRAVVNILYKIMAPYNLSKEGTTHFVRGFRSALHGFVSLEYAGFFSGGGADVDKSFECLIARLISTLD